MLRDFGQAKTTIPASIANIADKTNDINTIDYTAISPIYSCGLCFITQD